VDTVLPPEVGPSEDFINSFSDSTACSSIGSDYIVNSRLPPATHDRLCTIDELDQASESKQEQSIQASIGCLTTTLFRADTFAGKGARAEGSRLTFQQSRCSRWQVTMRFFDIF
jgi:hypothetical protein